MCKLHAGNRIRKIIPQSYITKPDISDTPDDDLTIYPDYDEEVFEKEAEEYYKEELYNPTLWFLVSNEFYLRDMDGKELQLFINNELKHTNMRGMDTEGYIDNDLNKFYYLKDHLGSSRVVVDENKLIISAQDYDM